ncbi:MAG: hypothetical protein IAG13_36625, partial [Deltaproteobacteria bacterium]|nr:hypothetical protein [Nannocystaceae bacterium]
MSGASRRCVAHAWVAALALVGCSAGEHGPLHTPTSGLDRSPIVPAKIDPLQPPPRDPVTADARTRTEAAAATTPPSQPLGAVDPALLSGTWTGTYLYSHRGDSSAAVAFFADLAFDGPRLRGSIIEPNSFGDDSSGELKATLAGSIDEHGIVRFTKSYDGTAGVDHRVDYIGRLDVAAQRIEGTWSIADDTGRFVMLRHHPLPQLAARQWGSAANHCLASATSLRAGAPAR